MVDLTLNLIITSFDSAYTYVFCGLSSLEIIFEWSFSQCFWDKLNLSINVRVTLSRSKGVSIVSGALISPKLVFSSYDSSDKSNVVTYGESNSKASSSMEDVSFSLIDFFWVF